MKRTPCLILLCLLSWAVLPLNASISGFYQAAPQDAGIWYTWEDLPSDVKACYQNLSIGNKRSHLYYHLGKLTLHIKAHEGDPVYYVTLQSPYTQNSVLSTVSWGGQQTSGVQLAIGIRCNGVVQKSLNLGVNSASWGGWLTISGNKNSYNKPFEEDTRIEVEFYLYTLNSMEFFVKDTPIYLERIDLQMGAISYCIDRNNTRKEMTLDSGSDQFDYWGGAKIPSDQPTYRSDSDKAHEVKQTLVLHVADNIEQNRTLDPLRHGVRQMVSALELSTSNDTLPGKDYSLRISLYDQDPIGSGSRYFYLHRNGDQSDHAAFLVMLDVDGQQVSNDVNQPITIQVPKGQAIPIRKLVNASFAKQDSLPAGTYSDTVFVDIVTVDS